MSGVARHVTREFAISFFVTLAGRFHLPGVSGADPDDIDDDNEDDTNDSNDDNNDDDNNDDDGGEDAPTPTPWYKTLDTDHPSA
jgi:hypothetical protein